MKKVTLLVAAIVVLVLGIGMTAKAASLKGEIHHISKEQYHIMEKEYVDEVRMILLEKGCKNAGVTLTYVTDTEGNREYTVTIHHTKLEKMDDGDMILLQARMQEAAQEILWEEVILKRL